MTSISDITNNTAGMGNIFITSHDVARNTNSVPIYNANHSFKISTMFNVKTGLSAFPAQPCAKGGITCPLGAMSPLPSYRGDPGFST